jgi:hypothetical protein
LNLSEYIKDRLSFEEYSFSLTEFATNTDKSEIALKREASYLVSKGDIIPVRKGFYLIIPPRYSRQGKLPIVDRAVKVSHLRRMKVSIAK